MYEGRQGARQASGVSTEEFDTKASAEVMMKGRYAALMQTKTKISFDLGNGHMAYNYPSTHGRPFAQWHPSWDPQVQAGARRAVRKGSWRASGRSAPGASRTSTITS